MRLSVVMACLSLCMIGFSSADDAHASIRKETHIPAEGLGPALNALAKDRNFQVVYVTEEIANVRTQGAIGEFTTEEALKRLLTGTGLTYRYLDDKTVTIGSATPSNERSGHASKTTSSESPGDPNSNQEADKSAPRSLRLAQSDQGPTSSSSTLKNSSESAENTGQLSEVIVTAQKREERLVDVPMSIIAVGATELQQRQITDIDELTFAVPGLAVADVSEGRRVTIRGVSNVAGNASLVGLYLDEADVTFVSNYQPDISTYDLERVEVLRGPQGTLYGEGSSGGTVRFITHNPVLDSFQMTSDVAALFTEGGAPSQRINEMVNVPLIEGEMGLRIAGTFNHMGGWIDQPAADRKDINDQNLVDVRVKDLWQVSPQFTVVALAEIHRNDRGSDDGENSSGNFTQAFGLTTTPRVQDNFDIDNLTMTYDFTRARLLSSTTYVLRDETISNYGYILPLNGSAATTPPYDVLQNPAWLLGDTFTQEVRLSSTATDRWQWAVGADYRRLTQEFKEYYYFGLPGPLPTTPDFYNAPILSKSWSVFGDTSYELIDGLTIGGGLRDFHDDRSTTGVLLSPTQASAPQSATFTNVDPRVYLQYKFSKDFNVYASAAKGFRSGGFNGEDQPAYTPESVWTYELGTKSFLADGRLSVDVALFDSLYKNYQIQGIPKPPEQPINITSNAGNATIEGVELDLAWNPSADWMLGINGDFLHAYFTQINATDATYDVGDSVDLVPKYQLSTTAERKFNWNGNPGFARLDYSIQGPETYRNRGNGPSYYDESDVIHMLNLNTGLQVRDNLHLGLFATNLLNDRGYLNPFIIENNAPRARPRTYGVEFSTDFK
jgi:iron complex outermembrane recepter protein